MFLTTPTPHKEAAKAIRDKTTVTRDVFNRLLPELQAAAFTVSGVECFDTLQRIKDAIATVPAGANWDTVKQQIEDEMEPWLDNEAASKARAALLLKLHCFRAYAATNHRLITAHADTFTYCQYIASGLDSMRPSHAALHKKVLPTNHVFWTNHTGPWAWGCKCEKVALLPEEVDEMRGEDAALPLADRRVLEGAARTQLEEEGTVTDSVDTHDIRTDREIALSEGKPNAAAAFEWRPGEIRMPLSKIKERYDPAVFKLWEASAKSTKLPDGRTLWAALDKKETAPQKTKLDPNAPANPSDSTPTPAPDFNALTRWIIQETGLPEEEAARYAAEIGSTPDLTPEGDWTAVVDGNPITIKPMP